MAVVLEQNKASEIIECEIQSNLSEIKINRNHLQYLFFLFMTKIIRKIDP